MVKPTPSSANDWDAYRVYILDALEKSYEAMERYELRLGALERKVDDGLSALNVKAGIWGGIGILLAAAGGVLYLLIQRLK